MYLNIYFLILEHNNEFIPHKTEMKNLFLMRQNTGKKLKHHNSTILFIKERNFVNYLF